MFWEGSSIVKEWLFNACMTFCQHVFQVVIICFMGQTMWLIKTKPTLRDRDLTPFLSKVWLHLTKLILSSQEALIAITSWDPQPFDYSPTEKFEWLLDNKNFFYFPPSPVPKLCNLVKKWHAKFSEFKIHKSTLATTLKFYIVNTSNCQENKSF